MFLSYILKFNIIKKHNNKKTMISDLVNAKIFKPSHFPIGKTGCCNNQMRYNTLSIQQNNGTKMLFKIMLTALYVIHSKHN